MIQLILHLWGDYLTQSDWMAQNKTKHWFPALCHAVVYSLPFLLIGSLEAVGIIFATHYLIDRFRLARYLVWAKNFLAPRWIRYAELAPGNGVVFDKPVRNYPWKYCGKMGYLDSSVAWLSVWLMILGDNTLHLTINYFSLKFL